MRPAPVAASSYLDAPSLRDRLGGATGALAVTALLLLMLLTLAPAFDRAPPARSGLSSFGLLPERRPQAKASRQHARRQHAKVAPVARAVTRPPARPAASHVDTSAWPAGMIQLNHTDFAASDIAKLPAHERARESADASGSGSAHGASSGRGEGAGGDQLYNADWYKRPTSAELAFYLPKTAPPDGWGEIACRTVDRYRVEDCHVLGEEPQGSGFGRAVLNAAWQFKVLPPRAGDHPLIGAWVRIRIEYYQRGGDLVGVSR